VGMCVRTGRQSFCLRAMVYEAACNMVVTLPAR
jgi:hypothetical protein